MNHSAHLVAWLRASTTATMSRPMRGRHGRSFPGRNHCCSTKNRPFLQRVRHSIPCVYTIVCIRTASDRTLLQHNSGNLIWICKDEIAWSKPWVQPNSNASNIACTFGVLHHGIERQAIRLPHLRGTASSTMQVINFQSHVCNETELALDQ